MARARNGKVAVADPVSTETFKISCTACGAPITVPSGVGPDWRPDHTCSNKRTGAAVGLKLDLGCGQNKREGFTGVDWKAGPGVDQVVDLEQFPWPWDDGSVEEVHVSHFAEHVSDFIKFMDEIHRVLRVGGQATIIGPYYTSIRAWQDPTHKTALSEHRFLYFNQGWREANKLEHYGILSDFDFVYGYVMNQDFASRSDETRDFAVKHYWNVVDDIHVTLTKRPPPDATPA